jgi:hypothetical protein
MEGAMNARTLQAAVLHLRLWLWARGPVLCIAALLCVAGAASLAWLLPQRGIEARRQQVAIAVASLPPAPKTAAPATSNDNLAAFYAVLGEKRYAEQQVATLFALAAKNGLSLSQGEYKGSYDATTRVNSYQVVLPVKGSYKAIWQFALACLQSVPFASLDEISFRRETIGEPNVDARLRLTFYLNDGAPR